MDEGLGKGQEHYESAHHRNARVFCSVVMGEVASRFPDLTIKTINQTDEDLDGAPELIREAKLSRFPDLERELAEDDQKLEQDSVSSTYIRVTIAGDNQERILKVVEVINSEAGKLDGQKADNTGVFPSQNEKLLNCIIGHKPELEDMPHFEEWLGYKFN